MDINISSFEKQKGYSYHTKETKGDTKEKDSTKSPYPLIHPGQYQQVPSQITGLTATPSLSFFSILHGLHYLVVGIQTGFLAAIAPKYKKGDTHDHWTILSHIVPNIVSLSQSGEKLWINRLDAVLGYRLSSKERRDFSPEKLLVPVESTILTGLNIVMNREDYLMTREMILKLEHNQLGIGTVWQPPDTHQLVNFWLVDRLPNYALTRELKEETRYVLTDLQEDIITELELKYPFIVELDPEGKQFWMIQQRDGGMELGILYPEGFLPKMKLPYLLITGLEFIDKDNIIISVNRDTGSLSTQSPEKTWSGF